MVISKNAVTSTTVYTVYTAIKPLVNADSPQVWESPHAELKKSLYLLLTIAELIWESGGTCFCVKRRVIGTHSHERSWMLWGGNTLLSLAVIPSSSLTGSVSLCSGFLSPCLLKPKNNPHSSAQQQLKSSSQSLFCSAHCHWRILCLGNFYSQVRVFIASFSTQNPFKFSLLYYKHWKI